MPTKLCGKPSAGDPSGTFAVPATVRATDTLGTGQLWTLSGFGVLGFTHRLCNSSFLWLVFRILQVPKKELLWSLWVGSGFRVSGSRDLFRAVGSGV